MNKPNLTVVIPCFNEEEVLPETHNRMSRFIQDLIDKRKISPDSQMLLVDDGSSDATWQLIKAYSESSVHVGGLKLSRNRGHQVALLAGLHAAKGNVVVSIDADLQDDIGVIETMLDRYHEGFEVVYGVRDDRTSDSVFKRTTAEYYYKILSAMGVEIVFNHADYRLLSRRAMDALKSHEEVNLFLRGIVPTLGFKSCQVTYERTERFAGESKYPLRKMLALAIDGITSFSAVPLRFIAGFGVLVFLVSLLISCWAIWVRLFSDDAVPGWASSVLPMYMLGGIQLLSVGVVGEYVAKIYAETKRRPKYFIEEKT
ncbi:glycosyltransferase family 2 protein [Marinobacterium rhizophilum]|uniref:glycosyltransferase family 2 protein n=1 Tax=Marinobacterium rhizophilum TaxID=420402 RepID=UPI00037164DC|nr:glycosyltransferase family 2 protein [Marinobacterium rhizophilum]